MLTTRMSNDQQHCWQVSHLAQTEPEAAPYLWRDDDDNSTLASTPSLHRGLATILRAEDGMPSHIILSMEHKVTMSKRAWRVLVNALKKMVTRLRLRKRLAGDLASQASSMQPSLGVNGVIV